MIYRVPVIFTYYGEAEIEAESPEDAWAQVKLENPGDDGWDSGTTTCELDGGINAIYEWDEAAQKKHEEYLKDLFSNMPNGSGEIKL